MNRKQVLDSINIILWIALAAVAILAIIKIYDNSFLLEYQDLNRDFATIALWTFLISVLPGSFLRLKIFPRLFSKIIPYRRTLGIFMYLMGFAHFMLVIDLIPFLAEIDFGLYTLTATGGFALTFLTPVVLTSTYSAQRFFKKHWKTVQRLTYAAFPALAWHFYETEHLPYTIIFLLSFLFIIYSYIHPKIFRPQPTTPKKQSSP